MRDPDGRLTFAASEVRRALARPLPDWHFLRTALAREWVSQGKLVDFTLVDESTITSLRRPFITLPTEWPEAQLYDAATLTLDLASESASHGFDMKDASAWNVIFDGTRAIFCDLLSFEPLSRRLWWAAGQFGRHFIAPLWLARRGLLAAHECFALWRDGVPAERARRLLGARRYLSRAWPVVAGAGWATMDAGYAGSAGLDRNRVSEYRTRLVESLRWMLNGVKPVERSPVPQGQRWDGYIVERAHYAQVSVEAKRSQVQAWLAETRAKWVADLGCNTGEFTDMALQSGAKVVAIDADRASVEQVYRRHRGSPDVFPAIAEIHDLTHGRGWAGTEFTGLPDRLAGRFDLVMMLALLHHLAIGAAVPFAQIAQWARDLTQRWLIIEWIDENDAQLLELCRQRQRHSAEFAVAQQRKAFVDAGFSIEAEVSLAPTHRQLALLRRG